MNVAEKNLRRGATILAIAAIAILGATIAIISNKPDPRTHTGRHLWAGALAIASLSIVEFLIALFPLRNGERWAFWAAAIPYITLGVPILILDAAYVVGERLINTLAPQVCGLIVALVGLGFSARGIFRSSSGV